MTQMTREEVLAAIDEEIAVHADNLPEFQPEHDLLKRAREAIVAMYADAERLDWLEKNSDIGAGCFYQPRKGLQLAGRRIRESLDAARKAA